MPSRNGEEGEERVLRAKYLDWCSARLAERFMELPPEEIYRLAQRASESDGVGEPPLSGRMEAERVSSPGSGTYRDLVERLTAVLAEELELPSFNSWRDAYLADSGRYETELLGLWEQELAESR